MNFDAEGSSRIVALVFERNIRYVNNEQMNASAHPPPVSRGQAPARRRRIQELLADHGRLAVEALATRLKVAPMTVRRDLQVMEREGLLLRVHGGCLLRAALLAPERSFSDKATRQVAAKRAIAQGVAALLHAGQTLYLDTGTTCVHVAAQLPTGLRLRVLTNNLQAAMELFGRPAVEVHLLGGRLAASSPDLVGAWAVARALDFRYDLAVLGADAIDPRSGEFGAADLETAALSAAAIRQADRIVLVADSSKIGCIAKAVTGRLGAGVTLVTDDGVSPAARRALTRHGARLIVAPLSNKDKETT